MNLVETSRDRAMRVLHRIRERTEHTQEPVVVTDLVTECQLSVAEAQAAWQYLREHRLIDTYNLRYSARINAKGIDLLDSTAADLSGKGHPKAGSSPARGYGRVDSQENLDRAHEVYTELERLRAFLPSLSDSEISACSNKSLPIGTFLQSKGQTFGVLPEDMLASAFKEEADRRKSNAPSRAEHEVPGRKRSRLEVASWIAGIVGAAAAIAIPLIIEFRPKSREAAPPSNISENKPTSGSTDTHTGESVPPGQAEPKVVLAAFNLDDPRGYFKETSPLTFVATNKYGRLAACATSSAYKKSPSYRKRCGNAASLTPVFDVTLTGSGNVVLSSIVAQVIEVTRMAEGGEGATVPKATIPVSAKYVIDLPKQQEGRENTGTMRIAAIPPLLISDGQPARFQIALKHHCVSECSAIFTFVFNLSTKEAVSTDAIQVELGREIPDECSNSSEDEVDRCVAGWDSKAQQEEKKREVEGKAPSDK
jgi:hypothetical protein